MFVDSNEKHLPLLDGIRGLLAMWVFVGHLARTVGFSFPFISRPGLAVDFFMLISGFLMMWHWMPREHKYQSFSHQSVDFYIRRVFRISPVYYFALTIVILFPALFISAKQEIGASVGNIIGVSSYDTSLQNVFFHFTYIFGLFPNYAQNNPLPDWSISLEMQFYFVFPMLVLVFKKINPIALAVMMYPVALAVNSCIGTPNDPGKWLTYPQPSLLPMRISVFLAGMSLAEVCRLYPLKTDRWVSCFLAFSLFLAPLDKYVIFGSLFLCVLIYAGRNRVSMLLQSPPLRYLGDLSYGVYLFHIPVMMISLFLITKFIHFQNMSPIVRFVFSICAITPPLLFVSYIIHVCIEKPGIHVGRQLSQFLLPKRQ